MVFLLLILTVLGLIPRALRSATLTNFLASVVGVFTLDLFSCLEAEEGVVLQLVPLVLCDALVFFFALLSSSTFQSLLLAGLGMAKLFVTPWPPLLLSCLLLLLLVLVTTPEISLSGAMYFLPLSGVCRSSGTPTPSVLGWHARHQQHPHTTHHYTFTLNIIGTSNNGTSLNFTWFQLFQ